MLVAEQFIQSLIKKYAKHNISTTDRVTWYHPQGFRFLNVEQYHFHFPYHKHYYRKIQSNT